VFRDDVVLGTATKLIYSLGRGMSELLAMLASFEIVLKLKNISRSHGINRYALT
jgi:hypothetical protein